MKHPIEEVVEEISKQRKTALKKVPKPMQKYTTTKSQQQQNRYEVDFNKAKKPVVTTREGSEGEKRMVRKKKLATPMQKYKIIKRYDPTATEAKTMKDKFSPFSEKRSTARRGYLPKPGAAAAALPKKLKYTKFRDELMMKKKKST